ncbi:MAG: 30S ribosomal protein S15 [Mycoplasma sp.]
MAVSKKTKAELVKQFGGSEQNTGKTEVQIAILTAEIKNLTEHMIINKKDKHSKRGLYMKVSKRKSLLTYLQNNDIEAYRKLIKELGLRG